MLKSPVISYLKSQVSWSVVNWVENSRRLFILTITVTNYTPYIQQHCTALHCTALHYSALNFTTAPVKSLADSSGTYRSQVTAGQVQLLNTRIKSARFTFLRV